MWTWDAVETFNIVQFIPNPTSEPAYMFFNYFFTLVCVVGMFAWGIGLLLQIVSRS
ncbi:MAG: hypothetical protein GY870_16950 [archaeon]|nr:hypothetical protein [archaeon]